MATKHHVFFSLLFTAVCSTVGTGDGAVETQCIASLRNRCTNAVASIPARARDIIADTGNPVSSVLKATAMQGDTPAHGQAVPQILWGLGWESDQRIYRTQMSLRACGSAKSRLQNGQRLWSLGLFQGLGQSGHEDGREERRTITPPVETQDTVSRRDGIASLRKNILHIAQHEIGVKEATGQNDKDCRMKHYPVHAPKMSPYSMNVAGSSVLVLYILFRLYSDEAWLLSIFCLSYKGWMSSPPIAVRFGRYQVTCPRGIERIGDEERDAATLLSMTKAKLKKSLFRATS